MGKYPKSARAQRREAEREQTKQKCSPIFNKLSAFEKIKPILQRYGWKYFSNHTDTALVTNQEVVNSDCAALVLTNNDYSFTICEYGDGVRLGKMEIWKKTENKIEAASILTANVVNFLLKNEVSNIHAFTDFIGHVKEENVVIKKDELEEMFLNLGFVKSGSNKGLTFTDVLKLKNFDTSNDSILFGDVESDNTGENLVYFKGQTQVYFEFSGNKSKNFTRNFYVGTDEEIKTELNKFIQEIKVDDEASYMIKTTVKAVIDEERAIPAQLLNHLAQSMIGVFLAKAAKEKDYQAKMTEISFHFIPLLHLLNKGNEKKYFQYKLLFNEQRETVDIATRTFPINAA